MIDCGFQGRMIAALDRLASMFWVFLLGGVFTPVLSAQMQDHETTDYTPQTTSLQTTDHEPTEVLNSGPG